MSSVSIRRIDSWHRHVAVPDPAAWPGQDELGQALAAASTDLTMLW